MLECAPPLACGLPVTWKNCTPVVWISLTVVLCAAAALGQNQTTGRIAGTVRDPRGSVVPGATVTVKNKTTAAERVVTTDDRGNYTVSLLPPGVYHLKVAVPGFNSFDVDPVPVGLRFSHAFNSFVMKLCKAQTFTQLIDARASTSTDVPNLDSRSVL